jgi:hypothetical protein
VYTFNTPEPSSSTLLNWMKNFAKIGFLGKGVNYVGLIGPSPWGLLALAK